MNRFVVLLLLVTLFAGCSEEAPPAVDDVVVLSGTASNEPQEVDSDKEVAVAPKGDVGHVAGFVLDDSLRTIEGAAIRLKALKLDEVSDRTGKFEFVDLNPGSYIISFEKEGHEPAQTVVKVQAGEFTRLKVILYRIPPPEPYVEVVKHEGFMDMANQRYATLGLMPCSGCSFNMAVGENATAVVFEAFDIDQSGGTGTDLIVYQPSCCSRIVSTESVMPLWVKKDRPAPGNLNINFDPWSPTVPEMNQKFTFFATAFYNMDVPAGYTAGA